MKLLYLHNADVSGHTANLTQVISMCNAFRLNKLQVVLLLPLPKNETSIETESRLREIYNIRKDIEIIFFRNFFVKDKIRKFTHHFFIKKYIKKINPDLCYTRDVNFLSICIKSKKKVIYESHNYKIHNGSKKINSFLLKKLTRQSKSKEYLFMVTISNMLKQHWISNGFEKSKIVSLHDGFIETKYINEITKLDARKELNLPQKEKLAIYTGNLYPNRGINLVITLAKKFKEATFIVVGGPEKFRKDLVNESETLNLRNIIFLGQVPFAKIHLYQFAADINLGIWSKEVPTINYCSPLKVFEYMAVSRAIVAMGFPSIKEVLVDGENAFVSDPYNSNDFINKFEEALNNPEMGCKLAKNARKEAFEKYTWNKRAKEILLKI